MSTTVIVTRHPALVAHLREIGLATPATPVLTHAAPEQIQGRRVIGVLPLHLAALAAEIVVVPLAVPPELRGVELTLDQVRDLAGEPETYTVTRRTGEP